MKIWEIPSSISVTPRFQDSTRLKWWALTVVIYQTDRVNQRGTLLTITSVGENSSVGVANSKQWYRLVHVTLLESLTDAGHEDGVRASKQGFKWLKHKRKLVPLPSRA